jgi:hypothetical protein
VGDFQLFGVVLLEVESDAMRGVDFGFGFEGEDLLGGVLGLIGLSEFFEADFLLGFPQGFVGCEESLDFGYALEQLRVVLLILSEPGFDGVDFGIIIEGVDVLGVEFLDS